MDYLLRVFKFDIFFGIFFIEILSLHGYFKQYSFFVSSNDHLLYACCYSRAQYQSKYSFLHQIKINIKLFKIQNIETNVLFPELHNSQKKKTFFINVGFFFFTTNSKIIIYYFGINKQYILKFVKYVTKTTIRL